jgi:methyltransferase
MWIAVMSLAVVLMIMLVELQVSRRHERALRDAGAIEPRDDVFETMRWAYPGAFVVMAVEGALFGPAPGAATIVGAALFVVAKLLKVWAMASLGERWTFRVLVLPGTPLVTSGPYALMRHPNYVAVVGELIAMALLVGARIMGPVATLLFTWLLRARTNVENRALRYPPCS